MLVQDFLGLNTKIKNKNKLFHNLNTLTLLHDEKVNFKGFKIQFPFEENYNYFF